MKSWACLTGYRAGKGSKPNFLIHCTAQNAWLPVENKMTVKVMCKLLIALGDSREMEERSLGLCALCKGF